MSQSDNQPEQNPSLAVVNATEAVTTSWVLLDCGEFNFLISGDEIVSLASLAELIAQSISVPSSCGEVEFSQQYYPVFCINKSLLLQSEITPEHQLIVLLNANQHLFSVSCRSIEKLDKTSLLFYSVPPSMRSRKQPFTQFSIINNRAAGLTSAEKLFTFLGSRGVVLAEQTNASRFIGQGGV